MTLDKQRRRQVETPSHTALEREPAVRRSFLGNASAGDEELGRVAIACTERGGSPTVRLVITQIYCLPTEALLRRGATVEIRPAF